MAPTTDTDLQTLALLRSLISAFEEKKAENLTVLHVSAQSNITDYLVLATGNSEPHLRALRIEAEKVLDAAKVQIAGMDQGGFGSGWTVVDAYQIMIHFFTAEQRENYALEKLWRDAKQIDVKAIDKTKRAPGKAVLTGAGKAAKGVKSDRVKAPATPSKKTSSKVKSSKSKPIAKPAPKVKVSKSKPTTKIKKTAKKSAK
jgi:ribosome-associated protein